MELRFEKLASEAVTWVATLKAHGIPDAHGALQDAARRNVHIGLHVESQRDRAVPTGSVCARRSSQA